MTLADLINDLLLASERFGGDVPVMVRIDHKTLPLASDSLAYNLTKDHVSIAVKIK